jgi:hypothetical protein
MPVSSASPLGVAGAASIARVFGLRPIDPARIVLILRAAGTDDAAPESAARSTIGGCSVIPQRVAFENHWGTTIMSVTIDQASATAKIVNPDPTFPKAELMEPTSRGYSVHRCGS